MQKSVVLALVDFGYYSSAFLGGRSQFAIGDLVSRKLSEEITKLSTRLGLIVGCAALGALILVLVALQTIRSSMLADREEQIRSMVNLTAKQVEVFVALEKSGIMSREEAEKAKEILAAIEEPVYEVGEITKGEQDVIVTGGLFHE